MTSILALAALSPAAIPPVTIPPRCEAIPAPVAGKTSPGIPSEILAGWNDGMELLSAWRPLPANAPQMWRPATGGLALRLPRVPDRWPYAYQWSGATREAIVDLGRYPVLLARVEAVDPGYAHLDVEERDVDGAAVRGRRTPTLTAPGIIRLDLDDPAARPAEAKPPSDVRRLTLRLIVGGPNEGAKIVARWVRFVSRPDAARLEANPDLPVRVVP